MRSFLKSILLLLLPIAGMAQNSIVIIKPAAFDTTGQQYLGAADGWIFKQGNDTAWAKTDIDINGWKKLKPMQLSAKYADKNGRLECWFRIKIKIDTSFVNQPLGYRFSSWAAADLYIDGKLESSFGNTGNNGKPFEEYNPFTFDHRFSHPLSLNPGDHIIALHFVDYLSPFPPTRLKSEDLNNKRLLSITNSKNSAYLLSRSIDSNTYIVIWVSVCSILSFLFWLLALQNPAEKNLRLIAVCTTFFALIMLCLVCETMPGTSYTPYTMYSYISNILGVSIIIIIPLILANIFKRRVSRILKIWLVILSIYGLFINFLPLNILTVSLPVVVLSLTSVCIYYTISSWKSLRGAQWSIVIGLFFSLLFILLVFFTGVQSQNGPVSQSFFYAMTGFVISFPLSLLIYVAMRFKEIINEVQQNAQQVLILSEEKREQAVNRQIILEEEVKRQTAEIRSTLDNLKATQTQLIQSEKMASLGELTAGIAHEIQNPLNFVNNFSEVSVELVDEMEEELDKGEIDEAKAIASDVKQNLEKIRHHGKRADAIVKGMLQHSQAGSGAKELTNINSLADEYLRLSYHGLRSKDKSFNAEMVTNFDEKLPQINVIPQDIGRVFLNLFNNAFYAVNQKQKTAGEGYKAEVSVTTSLENGQVIIKVKDNGIGIPDSIKEKIMQPFFTTKPTGEGTGLGLSLTYDMVVKGHGGSIQVNSVEGEGSAFQITLPV